MRRLTAIANHSLIAKLKIRVAVDAVCIVQPMMSGIDNASKSRPKIAKMINREAKNTITPATEAPSGQITLWTIISARVDGCICKGSVRCSAFGCHLLPKNRTVILSATTETITLQKLINSDTTDGAASPKTSSKFVHPNVAHRSAIDSYRKPQPDRQDRDQRGSRRSSHRAAAERIRLF